MLCELCKKNEAIIHIQEIVNSEKKTLNICAECAAQKNQSGLIINGLNLADLFYNLSSKIQPDADTSSGKQDEGEIKQQANIQCLKCGWDLSKFTKSGRTGCAECYKTFWKILSPAFKNMHKGTLHVGKHPGEAKSGGKGLPLLEIMDLQKKLEEHILREEFEKAAELRDKISRLKKTGG